LHTTRHYNGWVGDNPGGYTTNRTFHAWIDGGFVRAAGIDRAALFGRVRPARSAWQGTTNLSAEAVFPVAVAFVREQFARVEPFYAAEKAGKLTAEAADKSEGREMIVGQLLKSGQFLGDLWLSAWLQAAEDTYLRASLARRASEAAAKP
jgi:hypothetical protein